ncbi:MAG: hypothetical protein AB7T86_12325 [Xanthobacteraceae bacterium]|uniref:hypothetical protein n=1 Tax=Pseudolabrys sp. TaxID=1960880 RepID=UPI003D112013
MATARSSPASRKATRRVTKTRRVRVDAGREPAADAIAAPRDTVSRDTLSCDTMADRVQTMVARELDAVERVLDVLAPEGPSDAERAARTLASIARTLRELSLMNRAGDVSTGEGPEAATDHDDDPVPRDLDEFRRELARRINAFVEDRTGGGLPDGAAAQRDRGAGA